jgi:hypothetical protein
MKTKISFAFSLLLNAYALLAQDSTALNRWEIDVKDPFNDVHCPVPDGYSMWYMRQNLSCNGFQTILESNSIYNSELKNYSPEYRVETYIPTYKGKKFNAIVGSRYWRMSELKQIPQTDNTVQFLWLWTTFQYKPSERWNLILSSETYKRGNQTSFDQKLGNEFFVIGYLGYAFNKNWQIVGMGNYSWLQKPEGLNRSFLAAFQLKWFPKKNLKLMTGLPVIFATEWTTLEKFDLGVYCWYNMKNASFLRYRINNKFSISTIYKATDLKSDKVFTEPTSIAIENKNITYDNIYQVQHRLSLELGFKFTDNTSVQFNAGRILFTDTKYNYNDEVQLHSTKGNGWFAGVSVYYLNF